MLLTPLTLFILLFRICLFQNTLRKPSWYTLETNTSLARLQPSRLEASLSDKETMRSYIHRSQLVYSWESQLRLPICKTYEQSSNIPS